MLALRAGDDRAHVTGVSGAEPGIGHERAPGAFRNAWRLRFIRFFEPGCRSKPARLELGDQRSHTARMQRCRRWRPRTRGRYAADDEATFREGRVDRAFRGLRPAMGRHCQRSAAASEASRVARIANRVSAAASKRGTSGFTGVLVGPQGGVFRATGAPTLGCGGVSAQQAEIARWRGASSDPQQRTDARAARAQAGGRQIGQSLQRAPQARRIGSTPGMWVESVRLR
jgi:hypothetical protein